MTDPHDFEQAILKPLERILAICLATMEQAVTDGKLKAEMQTEEGEEVVVLSIDSVATLTEAASVVYEMRKDIEKSEKEFE